MTVDQLQGYGTPMKSWNVFAAAAVLLSAAPALAQLEPTPTLTVTGTDPGMLNAAACVNAASQATQP